MPKANFFTEGLFGRGNGVIYQSTLNLNPKRFADGDVIGNLSGYQSPGAGFFRDSSCSFTQPM
jgi:hypothetical protein